MQVLGADTPANDTKGYTQVWAGQNLSQAVTVPLGSTAGALHAYRYWWSG